MKNNKKLLIIVLSIVFLPYFINIITFILDKTRDIIINSYEDKKFNLIVSKSNDFYDDELRDFAKDNKIKLNVDYYSDLDIIEKLNSENDYDGVWMSNSIWLYMLNNKYLINDSKSIGINPVVMAVKKSKAEELGLTKNDVYNRDLLNAIKSKKLKYVMTSVIRTNTGATAYLGFLNSLAGSPEVLKSEMLSDVNLTNDLKVLFKGVERVSGDEDYLTSMFLNGNYEAMINYESTIIKLNKELIKKGKEPLYLIYPEDGVAINDMPFGYVNRNQEKKENFIKLQNFLRSDKSVKNLANEGIRTWYGGTNKNTNDNVFNKAWGIDTDEYLRPLKYPSKKVINEALDLYVTTVRKPTHTVFCLDVSGSMNSNDGLIELKDSLTYLLDREQARKDRLQFSDKDKISVLTFNHDIKDRSKLFYGNDTTELINFVNKLYARGGTNIYDSSVEALKILNGENKDEYNRVVILMTDGISYNGSLNTIENYYKKTSRDIPVYSIMFGESSEDQLSDIAKLTNGKVFDGKEGLKEAFKEVRSYS